MQLNINSLSENGYVICTLETNGVVWPYQKDLHFKTPLYTVSVIKNTYNVLNPASCISVTRFLMSHKKHDNLIPNTWLLYVHVWQKVLLSAEAEYGQLALIDMVAMDI